MRLRTRLALYFAPLVVVPLAVVVPSAISNLRRTLLEDLSARVERLSSVASSTVQQTGTFAERAIEELAGSEALTQVAQDLHQHKDPAAVKGAAERLMRAHGL